jgi:predicted double-glycine peptidase
MNIKSMKEALEAKKNQMRTHDNSAKALRREVKKDEQLLQEAIVFAEEHNRVKHLLLVGEITLDTIFILIG